MAIVSGHFVTILQPGLRQVWAGAYFQKSGKLWVPHQYQGQSIVMQILDDVGFFGPEPEEFDDWDDYLVAKAEWQYDCIW